MLHGYCTRYYYQKDENELSIEIGLFENHKFHLVKDFITIYDPDEILSNRLVDMDQYVDDFNNSFHKEKNSCRFEQEANKRNK